jgi:hypothetical protein
LTPSLRALRAPFQGCNSGRSRSRLLVEEFDFRRPKKVRWTIQRASFRPAPVLFDRYAQLPLLTPKICARRSYLSIEPGRARLLHGASHPNSQLARRFEIGRRASRGWGCVTRGICTALDDGLVGMIRCVPTVVSNLFPSKCLVMLCICRWLKASRVPIRQLLAFVSLL